MQDMDFRFRLWIVLCCSLTCSAFSRDLEQLRHTHPGDLDIILRTILHTVDEGPSVKDVQLNSENGGSSSGYDNVSESARESAKAITNDPLKMAAAKALTKLLIGPSPDKQTEEGNLSEINIPQGGRRRMAKMLLTLLGPAPVDLQKKSMPDFNPTGW